MAKSSNVVRPLFAIALVAMMSLAAFSGCIGKNNGNETPSWAEVETITSDAIEQEVTSLKSITASKAASPAEGSVIVVSDENPFYALIATPIAAYYEGGALKNVPLLVTNSGNTFDHIHTVPSIATEPTVYTDMGSVARFLQIYNPASSIMIGMDKLVATGTETQMGTATPVSYTLAATESYLGNVTDIAIALAKKYWSSADAAILIEHGDEKGYAEALNIAPLASYLNIPIIPVGDVTDDVATALSELGVKYTIICGDVKVPIELTEKVGALKRFASVSGISEALVSFLSGSASSASAIPYVVMANPLDTYTPVVIDQVTYGNMTGELVDLGLGGTAPYPGMPETGQSVSFNFTIPDDYKYANVIVNLSVDLSGQAVSSDIYNTRALIYIYKIDTDETGSETKTLVFFANAVAYDNFRDGSGAATGVWLYSEFESVNQAGSYEIDIGPIVGTGNMYVTPLTPGTTPFTATTTVQKLESATYPLMPGLSSLAPYLAAIHNGVVLANPEFALQVAGLGGCVECGDPAADEEAMIEANEKAVEVHEQFVDLLCGIYGVEGADQLDAKLNEDLTKAPYLAILGDTNMVPMYYYVGTVGTGTAEGGEGQPGDVFYSTVNPSLEEFQDDPNVALFDTSGEPMTAEVAVGRLTGWDVQDVSALIARSNFYDTYLANYQGPMNAVGGTTPANGFGAVAFNGLGSEPPIEAGLITALDLDASETLAGFVPWAIAKAELSGRDKTAVQWESSNFIWMVVHGFWYHFVPDAVMSTANGPTNPYAVKHVKYMEMGPSVMFLESCITARIDGLHPWNTISQAFMHAGVNTYIGGTRSMLGSIVPLPDSVSKLGEFMAKVFFGHLTGHYVTDSDPSGTLAGLTGDMDVGHAFLYSRNAYISGTGLVDSGETDTISVTVLFGDPAFNPYEPNHEGGIPLP